MLKSLSLLSLLGCMIGCVTGAQTDPHGGVVVERSKEQPPAWIELPAGQLHETPDLLKFVEMQSQHTDLPFGIKRTQRDALESSKFALKERARAELMRVAETKQVFTAAPPEELDQLILEVTDEIHREHAKVADIYFEKLQSDQPVGPRQITEYYRAQVLVHFPKGRFADLMQAMVSRLEGSQDEALRELGRVVRQSADEEITH